MFLWYLPIATNHRMPPGSSRASTGHQLMKNPFETEERRTFRETIKRYVETEIKPHADEWDEAGDFPWRVHEELGAMGYFGFGVSDKFGGLGFDDAFMRAAAAEEMARCGATGVWAGVPVTPD